MPEDKNKNAIPAQELLTRATHDYDDQALSNYQKALVRFGKELIKTPEGAAMLTKAVDNDVTFWAADGGKRPKGFEVSESRELFYYSSEETRAVEAEDHKQSAKVRAEEIKAGKQPTPVNHENHIDARFDKGKHIHFETHKGFIHGADIDFGRALGVMKDFDQRVSAMKNIAADPNLGKFLGAEKQVFDAVASIPAEKPALADTFKAASPVATPTPFVSAPQITTTDIPASKVEKIKTPLEIVQEGIGVAQTNTWDDATKEGFAKLMARVQLTDEYREIHELRYGVPAPQQPSLEPDPVTQYVMKQKGFKPEFLQALEKLKLHDELRGNDSYTVPANAKSIIEDARKQPNLGPEAKDGLSDTFANAKGEKIIIDMVDPLTQKPGVSNSGFRLG